MITSGIFFLFISIVTFSLFTIAVKWYVPKHILPFLFWVNVITYIGFLGIFFYRKIVLQHDMQIMEELLYHYSFANAPLYIMLSICFVGTYIIFDKLIETCELSQVMALSQINILFSFVGFALMGDSITLKGTLEVLIVMYGALISGMPQLSYNPRALFATQSWDTIKKIVLYSALTSLITLITFLLTKQTVFNQDVVGSLKHVFPFSFYNPFYFNVGARLFIMITFFVYLWCVGCVRELIPTLKEKTVGLCVASLLFLVSSYTYQLAFDLIPNRSVFSAIYKFTTPCVLLFGVFLLQEKATLPKIIGSIIIVAGGAAALLM